MAEIIGHGQTLGRIEDHIRKNNARRAGAWEEIAAAAQDRLAPAIAAIDAATALQKTTDEAEATAWAQVLARTRRATAPSAASATPCGTAWAGAPEPAHG